MCLFTKKKNIIETEGVLFSFNLIAFATTEKPYVFPKNLIKYLNFPK